MTIRMKRRYGGWELMSSFMKMLKLQEELEEKAKEERRKAEDEEKAREKGKKVV